MVIPVPKPRCTKNKIEANKILKRVTKSGQQAVLIKG